MGWREDKVKNDEDGCNAAKRLVGRNEVGEKRMEAIWRPDGRNGWDSHSQ